jgi:N-acetylmuramoyl-L-alanine amidase
MQKRTIVLLDNGHGKETPGKRSPVWPDGTQLFEWEFNRDVAKRTATLCHDAGIEVHILVPEETDITLGERCRRANKYDADKSFLLSVHANAGGGTGFEAYTSKGNTQADEIADILYSEAEREFTPDGWKVRKDTTDGDSDKESNFYILKHTSMPAVLAEFFFMDTEKDCKFIMSETGRQKCAEVLFRTICRVCGRC